MVNSHNIALGAMAALPLFLQPTFAADNIPVEGTSFIMGGTCDGLKNTNFNATGSFKHQEFLPGTSLNEWTWHTGLRANTTGGTPRQYFWVDTAGSYDLNSAKLPWDNLCLDFYTRLPEEIYANAAKDNGSCETMIGKECLDALRSEARGGTCSDISRSLSLPDECKALFKGTGSSSQGIEIEFGPGSSSNKTCGSTVDNPTGDKSYLFSVTLRNDTAQGTEVYDQAVKHVYFTIWTPIRTEGSTTAYDPQFMCFKNTDIAEGSRNPLSTPVPQPSPTQPGAPQQSDKGSSSVNNSISMTKLFTAVIGVLIMFR